MRRPKYQAEQVDPTPETGDRSPESAEPTAPPEPTADDIAYAMAKLEDLRDALRKAYWQGSAIDPGSEAAGEAFLALSFFNRRNPEKAAQHAARAVELHQVAWSPLLDCFSHQVLPYWRSLGSLSSRFF